MQELTVSTLGTGSEGVITVSAQSMFNWLVAHDKKLIRETIAETLQAPKYDPEEKISCAQIAKENGFHTETVKRKRRLAIDKKKITEVTLGQQAAIKRKDIETVLRIKTQH